MAPKIDEIAKSQKSASIIIPAKQTVSQFAKGVISGTARRRRAKKARIERV